MEPTIDDREHELITEFIRQGLPFEVKRLEVGDVVLGRAVVERKEAQDFISSIVDGRLVNQIKNMQENFEKVCLVIHGEPNPYKSEINPNSVWGMLASISAKTRVNIMMFLTLEYSAQFIYRFMLKANEEKPSVIFNIEKKKEAKLN